MIMTRYSAGRRPRLQFRSVSEEAEIPTERTALLTDRSHYVREIQALIEEAVDEASEDFEDDIAEAAPPYSELEASRASFWTRLDDLFGLEYFFAVRPHDKWFKDLETQRSWVCLACMGRAWRHGYTCYGPSDDDRLAIVEHAEEYQCLPPNYGEPSRMPRGPGQRNGQALRYDLTTVVTEDGRRRRMYVPRRGEEAYEEALCPWLKLVVAIFASFMVIALLTLLVCGALIISNNPAATLTLAALP